MLKAKDFRFYAREALKGRWLKAGAVGLLAGLLGASIDMATASGSTGSNAGSSVGSSSDLGGSIANLGNFAIGSDVSAAFMAIFLGILLVVLIYAIVMAVIGGATTLGYAKYNLNLVDDKDPRVGDLFSQFNRLGTGFGMQFFRGLFIFLWSLLLVIPGIIATYRYYMTPYILCEHPEMTAREAIKESKQLMKGNKWRLFCLEFSFIGWELLIAAVMLIFLALGFGPFIFAMNAVSGTAASAVSTVMIVVSIVIVCVVGVVASLLLSPYVIASTAVFYREISEGRYSNPQVEGEAEAYTYEDADDITVE